MRIASRFQRSGRSNDRRRRALAAGVWVGLISFGCFFELEPVVELDGGVGGGGTAGAFAGEAGESPLGGNGGDGVGGTMAPQGCELAGQKRCGGECVIASPSNGCGNPDCTPCAELDNAVAPSCSSDSGSCKIDGCQVGFADCDGDLLTYNGQSGGNGCEYSFGTVAAPTQLLAVPRARELIQVADDSRDDWSDIPAYRLEQTCVDCRDDGAVFQPSAQNEAPAESDLSAYFRVAWDGDFFYVLAEAFDERVFSEGSTVDNGACQTNGDYVPGPVCEDGFTVYFDGRQDGGNFGNEDRRIIIGASGISFAPAQGQPPDGTVGMRVLPSVGPRCYRIEAQFKWTMLVSNQGEPVDGKFPPAANQTYGFDIAVSDWDPSVSDPSVFERQSQLFWAPRAAQSQLHPSIAGVGSIILTEHAADGEATAPQ
jgi:hypothetical protein